VRQVIRRRRTGRRGTVARRQPGRSCFQPWCEESLARRQVMASALLAAVRRGMCMAAETLSNSLTRPRGEGCGCGDRRSGGTSLVFRPTFPVEGETVDTVGFAASRRRGKRRTGGSAKSSVPQFRTWLLASEGGLATPSQSAFVSRRLGVGRTMTSSATRRTLVLRTERGAHDLTRLMRWTQRAGTGRVRQL
jgi:hypothetical protein